MPLHRLSSSADLRRVHASGRRARRNGVVVTCAPRPDGGPARVGLSVRRTAGGAVQRNRIKRRLRAAASSCELPPGADFVISGDASVATADFDRLVSAVAEAAAEVGGAR